MGQVNQVNAAGIEGLADRTQVGDQVFVAQEGVQAVEHDEGSVDRALQREATHVALDPVDRQPLRGGLLPSQGQHLLAQIQPGGGYAAAGVSMIDAQGTTRDGARGSERLWIPTGALGADVRWRITSSLELRLAGQAGVSAWRPLLAINEAPVLDLGRFELSGRVSLVFVSR